MTHHSSLFKKRIVITRSAAQAASFRDKLTKMGAEPVLFPVIELVAIAPPEGIGTASSPGGGGLRRGLNEALAQFERYDWIVFTSVNAVEFFFRQVDALALTLKMPKVATVGSATAVALQSRRIPINYTPKTFTGEALAAGLGNLTGQRILLPRARIGRPEIVKLLRDQGAEVDDVALYDTVTAVPTPAAFTQLEQGFDIITFTSPSSVRNFLKIIGDLDSQQAKRLSLAVNNAVIACIGPVTADEARIYGLTVAIMPDDYTIDGLVQAITAFYLESRD